MNESSQEPLATKSSWSPYMCPACRGLFRAPTGKVGKASCPLCESKIALPKESVAEEQAQPSEPQRRKRRKHTSPSQAKSASWEQGSSEEKRPGASKGLIFTSLFLISILVGVSGFLLIKERKQRLASTPHSQGNQNFSRSSNSSLEGSDFFNFPSSSSPDSNKPLLELQPSDIKTAQDAAERFLNCETVEDFAPLIRDPERVMPLIREFYRQTPYEQVGVLATDENQGTQVAKRFASFSIVLKDYSSRLIALEFIDTKPLVDWESWVGYCAIPWETFIEEKVVKPTEVRVSVQRAFYYNFSFRDDSQWACYRLTTSTDASVIYGYAPHDASFLRELPDTNEQEESFVLQIRFPDTAVTSNQVLITELLQSGWVIGL